MKAEVSNQRRLQGYSAGAAFIAALFSLLFLSFYMRPWFEYYFQLPPLAVPLLALLAGGISGVISRRFDPNAFGIAHGMWLATQTFILFCLIHAVLFTLITKGAEGNFEAMLWYIILMSFSNLLYGGLLVGWLVLITGALYGFLYRRTAPQ